MGTKKRRTNRKNKSINIILKMEDTIIELAKQASKEELYNMIAENIKLTNRMIEIYDDKYKIDTAKEIREKADYEDA